MNEHTICSKLKNELEKTLPRAVVFKHADVSTLSVPDLSVTIARRTSWLEVKFVRAKPGTKSITSKQVQENAHQHATMLKLEREGDAWYVIVTRTGLRSFHVNLVPPGGLTTVKDIPLPAPTKAIDYKHIINSLF